MRRRLPAVLASPRMPRSIGLVLVALAMTACAIRAPIASGPVEPASQPESASPAPSADMPSAAPSPPVATPAPSPTPNLGAMDLEAISCNGGVVLHWTASLHPDFHHYVTLRSPEFEIDPAYPPIAPAVDWGRTYATDRFVTSAVDASILPSATLWYYRVMAYDADGRVLGASPVRGARIGPVKMLAPVTLEAVDDGRVRLAWGLFRGRPECFTSYQVLYGTGGTASTLLATVSDPAQTELETDALAAGVAYTIRVEAVSVTTLGTYVAGRTEPVTVTRP